MSTNLEQNLQALGEVLRSAQCQRCYYYPGMKGEILAETIDGQIRPSFNERNAFEFGYGACLVGARTAVIMKTVGLATCLDSVQHAVLQGVHAGMVVIILEDTVAASSPEIVDSRLLMDYAGTMVIEPRSMQSALERARDIFRVSETLDVPVVMRLTYNLLNSEPARPPAAPKTSTHNVLAKPPAYREKMIGFWSKRAEAYERKLDKIDKYIDDIYQPLIPEDLETIWFGYTKDEGRKGISIEHYPIAKSLRKAYVDSQKEPIVHEHGSSYAKQQLHSTAPLRVDNTHILTPQIPPITGWEEVLRLINKQDYKYVVADHGRFTLDPTNLIDVCLSMGSSISVCAGMSEATSNRNLAIIGDFSYLFNGYQSILEAHYRGANMDILILDDAHASSTGGQVPLAPVELQPITTYVEECSSYDIRGLPNSLFSHKTNGVAVCHIKRRDA